MVNRKNNICLNNKNIIITGAAGFIGANLIMKLLKENIAKTIIGIDCLTDYNPVELKKYRLNQIDGFAKKSKSLWKFYKIDISDMEMLKNIFETYKPSIVVNLAAQAGVRYSIEHPETYIHSNLIGFYNILECCRYDDMLEHLIYASSSSVYGENAKLPFSEDDKTDNPISLYAATKKSNELLACSYSRLYNIPITGLRFFTVYGPVGRTDMAYFLFTEKLYKRQKIKLYNNGNCMRDFTYIDDVIESIMRIIINDPVMLSHNIYNIGNSHPERLMDFVKILSEELIKSEMLPFNFDLNSYIELMPIQSGDVLITYADTSKLEKDFGYKPYTDLRTGIRKFVEWYKTYSSILY